MLTWAVVLFLAAVLAPLLGLEGPSHFFFIFLVVFLVAVIVRVGEAAKEAGVPPWKREAASRRGNKNRQHASWG